MTDGTLVLAGTDGGGGLQFAFRLVDLYSALKKAGLVSQADVESFKNPDVREGGSIISSTKVGSIFCGMRV